MKHETKLILHVIMARSKVKIQHNVSVVPYGFVKDFGAKNSIFILTMLCGRSIDM